MTVDFDGPKHIDDEDISYRSDEEEEPEDPLTESEPEDEESSGSKHLIAQKETLAVNRSKLMVYIVLLMTAAAASALTYVLIRGQEDSTFQTEFKGFAKELERISQASASSKFSVARSLSITITSYAVDRNFYFPFVTLPDFEIRTEEARELSQAEVITFVPIVHKAQQNQWEQYARDHQDWIRLGLDRQGLQIVDPGPVPPKIYNPRTESGESQPGAQENNATHDEIEELLEESLAPIWQMGRAPINAGLVNLNILSDDIVWQIASDVMHEREAVMSPIVNLEFLYSFSFSPDRNQNVTFNIGDGRKRRTLKQLERSLGTLISAERAANAHSFIMQPVVETLDRKAEIVGFLMVVVPWESYFQNVYPEDVKGVEVVVSDSCGSTYTYRIDGSVGTTKGWGDLHDPEFDSMRARTLFTTGSMFGAASNTSTQCQYVMDAYPTSDLQESYESNDPVIYAIVVATIFMFTASMFALYDFNVGRRQRLVLQTANQTQAIVSSLFPKNIQDRILADAEEQAAKEEMGKSLFLSSGKDRLTNFLRDGEGSDSPGPVQSKPIADLFPFATIIFADIVGFTAWSSTREPPQVFLLLETLYHHFDLIAKRRRVFKVETVGDCYVAVAGLPDPRKDHATVMARFAQDCLFKFKQVVRDMVVTLGPDTEDLGLRVGLHSGPVTAGVLRGERARFQLFGDTVNTAARMESTGHPNQIQTSQDTADLLVAAGKSEWIRPREDKIEAKGKGTLQTYWLDVSSRAPGVSQASTTEASDQTSNGEKELGLTSATREPKTMDQKHQRLINWNAEVLSKSLSQVVAHRTACQVTPQSIEEIAVIEGQVSSSHIVLGEVQEIVNLPEYDPRAISAKQDLKLEDAVTQQLSKYVQSLAAMYRDNPFHNFEHASHVTMSVSKLLSRIVAPDLQSADTHLDLHDHTYGITSDPLTRFSVLLSALIHDVDHPGVPNETLVKEETSLAKVYENKSVAEQNSVDLAWALLMEDDYIDLRRAIYVTKEDFLRFRELIVNSVMATDIMDKELKNQRNARWDTAFSDDPKEENPQDVINRKATIVIEHLIQASDVAHTMQHWHIYRKWNTRLFKELYEAYLEGRADSDPSTFWYKGEIGFLDFYVIPLAKKLKDCGVFGVSSDEYLLYAMQNRKEWIAKGESIVAEMLQSFSDQGLVLNKPESAAGSVPAVVPVVHAASPPDS